MLTPEAAFDLAVRNISRWGDTDVFPFAPENHILHDSRDKVTALLKGIHGDLEASLIAHPPLLESSLSLISYEGFRWVTQIDPAWNAYFLGLVLRLAPEVEAARLPTNRQTIYSYRLDIDEERASLFRDGAWSDFSDRSAELAREYEYVVICDIADFYSRLYHHRVKNALQLLPGVGDEPSRLERLLREFSGGPSYGLPVGGPAARILAELTLNRTDRLLVTQGVSYCRYADDYRLYAHSRDDAFRSLTLLAGSLLRNEGLTLQRHKTRVVATKDFLRSPLFLSEDSDELSPRARQERRFLRLSLRYDPYSPTAEEDYGRLKSNLEQFDILGMLTEEVNKSRINPAVVRRLAQAMVHLAPDVREEASRTLVDNLEVLIPALPVVLRVLDTIVESISESRRLDITTRLRSMIESRAYYLDVGINKAYALRVLRHDPSEESVSLCTQLFQSAPAFIQRDIVYLMYSWGADYWLSDMRRQWANQHPWVKRALLLTSFALGDEGRHWRRAVSNRLSEFDGIAREWMAERIESGRRDLPL